MDKEKRKRLEEAGWKVGDANEFLAEHVCEWVWNNDLVIPFICSEPDCRRFLDHDDCEVRLNATERLSAEVAKGIYDMDKQRALFAYADILEGK
jgi:hypothetical protein